MKTMMPYKTDNGTLSIKGLCVKQIQTKNSKTWDKTGTGQTGETGLEDNRTKTQDNRTLLNFQKNRNRQFLLQQAQDINLNKKSIFDDKKLFDGIPANAAMLFPCREHVPDLQGYGIPSSELPEHLQIFGYWGWRLKIGKGDMADIIPGADKPADIRHCSFWLYHNYDECLEAQKSLDHLNKQQDKKYDRQLDDSMGHSGCA